MTERLNLRRDVLRAEFDHAAVDVDALERESMAGEMRRFAERSGMSLVGEPVMTVEQYRWETQDDGPALRVVTKGDDWQVRSYLLRWDAEPLT